MQTRAENLDIKVQLTEVAIVTNNFALYSCHECFELYKVLTSISDQDLGEKVVQILSFTGVSINQDDIVQCHRL